MTTSATRATKILQNKTRKIYTTKAAVAAVAVMIMNEKPQVY